MEKIIMVKIEKKRNECRGGAASSITEGVVIEKMKKWG